MDRERSRRDHYHSADARGTLQQGAHRVWSGIRQGSRWAGREAGDPLVCLACIFAGVLGSSFLAAVFPSLPFALPIVDMTRSPITALVVAIIVFKVRAYARWRAAQRLPLVARLLQMVFEGATWMFCWRAYVYRQSIVLWKLLRRIHQPT